MTNIDIKELTKKIVDVVAEWEAHSMSSFGGLKIDIKRLLEKELNENNRS